MDDLREFLTGDTDYIAKLNANSEDIVNAVTAVENGKVNTTAVGAPSGVASLNSSGVVPSTQLDITAAQIASALDDAVAPIDVNGQVIQNLGAPVNGTDAATRAYVDSVAQGLSILDSCAALSDSNIASLSGLATTVDGVLLNVDGTRVLLNGQTSAVQNGVWLVHSGAWTRATDLAAGSDAHGAFVFVDPGGTNYGGTGWVCNTAEPNDVVGTNAIAFTQFSSGGAFTEGFGIDISGSVIAVDDTEVQSLAEKDAANGYAGLDGAGLLDPDEIPPQPYDFVIFYPGVPTDASQLIARIRVVRAVTLPASLTGSYADAVTAATGSTTMTIERNGSGIGSIHWNAAATTATFTFAAPVTFSAGDVLTITGPATPDATLADISITLAGTR